MPSPFMNKDVLYCTKFSLKQNSCCDRRLIGSFLMGDWEFPDARTLQTKAALHPSSYCCLKANGGMNMGTLQDRPKCYVGIEGVNMGLRF